MEAYGEEVQGEVNWYYTDYDWRTIREEERSGILTPMKRQGYDWSKG